MKKQKNVTIKELGALAHSAKMPEIAPPDEAKRDGNTGKYTMTFKDALQTWFKTSKQVSTTEGFLGVKDDLIDPKSTQKNKNVLIKKGEK